ncbi:MAG TPA: hypothetical protein PLU24_05605, partial [Candidatus Omnitrophota bacterium]|nr:hypothetical protein [Candidatus Omnitrophota bacterium]
MRILSRFFGKKGRDKRKKVRVPVGFDLLYHVKGKKEIELEIGKREICTHMFDLSEGGMAMWVKEPERLRVKSILLSMLFLKKGR